MPEIAPVDITCECEPVELLYSVFDPPSSFPRYGHGWVKITFGDEIYVFHPREWNPDLPFEPRNPVMCSPVDPKKVNEAKAIKLRIEAWIKANTPQRSESTQV